MAILKAPILCDCTTKKICKRVPKCDTKSIAVGAYTYTTYDCKTGTTCGVTSLACSCDLTA